MNVYTATEQAYKNGYEAGAWYDKSATDEQIKECRGDYIGCEICVNAGRCFSLLLEKLNKVSEGMRKEDEGK